jgi:serine/threonine protein kinase
LAVALRTPSQEKTFSLAGTMHYHPVHQRGITVSATTSTAQQPEVIRVVYKIPNARYYETGEATPETSEAYAAVLRDFLVLSHESTVSHKNLLTLIRLAWGNMPGARPYMVPVPIVQYADFGCLADLQKSKQLCNSHKLRLLMDMATGLEFLHRCDIVHGDFKSENVLVFAHPDFRYFAKLSNRPTNVPPTYPETPAL